MTISQEDVAPTVDLLQDLAVVCQDTGHWSTADRIQEELTRLDRLIRPTRQPSPTPSDKNAITIH